MAIPLVTTSEPLNKGRFPVFFLTSSSFTGYNIGPGRNIPYLDTADEFQDVLFLTCKNYKKRGKGMICASSDAKFENLPPDEPFPCSLILMQGVFFCNEEKSFKFAFYKWKGPSSELDSISCVIKSYGCCRRFVRDMFDPQLLTSPVDLMHLRYLNQITGPSLPGWDVNIKVVRTPRGEFYESGEAPDSWLNSYHCPLTLRRKLLSVTPSEMHPKCFLPLRRNREMKNFEIPSTTQWKNSTLKLLLCKKSDEGLNTGRFLLQPVPTGEPSVQLFALITRNQLSELNELLLQCHPTCWMTWEAFTSKMRSYTNANGIEDFIRLNTFQASVTCPVVVSVVDNFAQQGGSYLSPSVKEEVLKRNILDWEIPGVVLFRGYAWSYEPSIDNIHINFLEKVYFGNGLTRSRCDHVGSFTMNGRRQSNMASASIGQAPGRARMHMYWDPKKMNPSLLPLGRNIINLISNEATNVQDHCGGVIIGLQVKAMKTYLPENEQLHSHGICPYKILTTSCFANTMHVDNDKMSKDDTCLVNKLVQEKGSEHDSAFEYLCRMRQLYPFTNTRLPLPTTCCWRLVDHVGNFKHHQFFVLLDFNLAFDLSSSVFDSTTKQVGATFSGSLFHHLTSLPLWTDGNMVTTICQRQMYNFAWGSSGGPAEKNK